MLVVLFEVLEASSVVWKTIIEAKNKLIANFIQNIRMFSIVKVLNFSAIKNLIIANFI